MNIAPMTDAAWERGIEKLTIVKIFDTLVNNRGYSGPPSNADALMGEAVRLYTKHILPPPTEGRKTGT